jgi:DNA-binding NarL/FixJ family response regulator
MALQQLRRIQDAVSKTSGEAAAPIRVLVIGNQHLVNVLRRSAESRGLEIRGITDARLGLAAAKGPRQDVILLSDRPPAIRAIGLLEAFRAAQLRKPVIVLAASGSHSVAFRAGQLGAAQYVTRPCRTGVLIHEIKHAVEQARATAAGAGRVGTSQAGPERPLYSRWLQAMLAAINAPRDPANVEQWAACAVTSVGALRSWCRTSDLPVKRSLLLARVLRAVKLAQTFGGRAHDFLSVADRRTLEKILQLAGVSGGAADLNVVLSEQRLVRNAVAVGALASLLLR